MANKNLTFLFFAKDNSSKTMKSISDNGRRMGDSLGRAGVAIGAGLAVAAGAAIAFGVESVKAFAEAEAAQQKLSFAFEKFPALADTSLAALQRFNSGLALKTRFDDDAIASGQAVLAQFGLTGSQLKKLTPLLLDYAGQTGKDLPAAAEDLGRALLGQGRALKGIGIEFADTGSLAGNFDQLVQDLSGTVGGFAEKDAETAAGKLEMLRNRFGEVQETVGAALMPALEALMDWFDGEGMAAVEGFATWLSDEGIPAMQEMVDWVVEYKDNLGFVAGAIGAATAAQWLLNAATAANPWGFVITSLIAVGAWTYWVITNFETAQGWMLDAADNTVIFLARTGIAMNSMAAGVVNSIGSMINAINEPLNALLRVLGLPQLKATHFSFNNSGLQNLINQSVGNMAARNPSGIGGGGGGGVGRVAMAAGGIVRPTPGGTRALIGEAGEAEAVIPLSRAGLAKYGIGGGGDIHVHLAGVYAGDKDSLARTLVSTIRDAQRSGAIGRTQFA